MLHTLESLPQEEKSILEKQIADYALLIGGKNAFLKLVETIHNASHHPLTSKKMALEFSGGLMRWNKQIHRNNLTLLSIQLNSRTQESNNLMPSTKHKDYKKISNMLRSLSPLKMTVNLNNDKSKPLFEIKAFQIEGNFITRLNPLFDLLFFAPLSLSKKIIHQAIK